VYFRLIIGVRFPKFIRAASAQLYSLAENPQPPPPPQFDIILNTMSLLYLSINKDDISFLPPCYTVLKSLDLSGLAS
jgi:hypothetical protein